MKRTTEKKQTLEDIANSIISITGDDEHLSKISLKALEGIYSQLSGKEVEKPPPTEEETSRDFSFFIKDTPIYSSLLEDIENSQFEKLPPKPKSKELSELDDKILRKIQCDVARKISKNDLVNIAKFLSNRFQITLLKRNKRSKKSVLDWISANWEMFEPSLPEAVKASANPSTATETDDNKDQEN